MCKRRGPCGPLFLLYLGDCVLGCFEENSLFLKCLLDDRIGRRLDLAFAEADGLFNHWFHEVFREVKFDGHDWFPWFDEFSGDYSP